MAPWERRWWFYQRPDNRGEGQASVEGEAYEVGGQCAAEVNEHEIVGEDAATQFGVSDLQRIVDQKLCNSPTLRLNEDRLVGLRLSTCRL